MRCPTSLVHWKVQKRKRKKGGGRQSSGVLRLGVHDVCVCVSWPLWWDFGRLWGYVLGLIKRTSLLQYVTCGAAAETEAKRAAGKPSLHVLWSCQLLCFASAKNLNTGLTWVSRGSASGRVVQLWQQLFRKAAPESRLKVCVREREVN